jgi:hypothetical protein|tara:strand:- start:1591 stop:2001 length:411 start_codon:yes stop_codon:yes gene_type:complete
MRLTQTFKNNEKALLDYCKKFSGSYINNLNKSSAPFATTYSTEFCDAASDLIRLYKRYQISKPINRLTTNFQENKIYTCRDHDMTISRAQYLYKNHLFSRLKNNDYIVLTEIKKEKCPSCGKLKTNLQEHIKAVHS